MRIKSIDLDKLKTYPIRQRRNLVNIKQFARLSPPPRGFRRFINELPDILAGRDFKQLIEAIAKAVKQGKIVGVALGAHIIKCGLSPVIIDLMKRGVIRAVAMNGAGAIHDYEISLIGATSEDVRRELPSGKFGMARETPAFFARAAQYATRDDIGLGMACGKLIRTEKNRYAKYSIMAEAERVGVPVTVHIAFGTDTIHMHPNISGATLGEATMTDFRLLASVICHLEGGVWLNIGSAVILPEVFLKAVTIAHNLGYKLKNLTTANLDMIQHYRPRTNVTDRPTERGINLTGHHEIMLPLFRWAVLASLNG